MYKVLIVFFINIFLFQPTYIANTQPVKVQKIDTLASKLDSLSNIKEVLQNKFDSVQVIVSKQASRLEKANEDIEERAQVLKNKVANKMRTRKESTIVTKIETVFVPVNKSEYYLQSKHETDSIAALQHKEDSLANEIAWELKHRSIFQKIFGSKIKK